MKVVTEKLKMFENTSTQSDTKIYEFTNKWSSFISFSI